MGEARASDRIAGRATVSAANRAPWRGLAALAFVAVSLVALVVVPTYYGDQVTEAQSRITDVLEPAAGSSSALSLILSRQMARMEGFLLTGDRAVFREPYMAAYREKEGELRELRELVDDLEEDTRDEVLPRVAALVSDWTRWDVDNQAIFEDGPSPEAEARLRERYAGLEQATRELNRAIESAVEEGRRDMDAARSWQTRSTFALALVALFGTVIVGRIGHRYRDLTLEAEKRGREAVQARREIDALLEATGDGVLGIDLDGRCTSLNRAGVLLLGYGDSEIRGRDVHDTLFHSGPDGSPNPRGESRVLAALSAGEPLDSGAEDVLWRRRRIPFPARWSLRPLVDGIELRGAVLTFTDMTEIRDKEEALHRAIRQREDVVSIVSHDLRNPLGVVLAAADLLIDLPLDEQQRRRQAQVILRSGRRMQSLIEDLLDVSRIEEGALVVRPSLEELPPILEEARDTFRDQAERKEVALVVRLGEGELVARIDRDRIMQALANLLDNAIRVVTEGGQVVLSAEDLGTELAVSVADDGPGIPPEALEQLFDRFAQSEDARRGGAGLGLAIVDGVAKAHGGTVTVDSKVGEGTRFSLVLPKAGPDIGEEGIRVS